MSFSFQQPFGQYKGTRNATMIQHMTTHTHHNLHLLQYLHHSHITMTSTLVKCISLQAGIQIETWQAIQVPMFQTMSPTYKAMSLIQMNSHVY